VTAKNWRRTIIYKPEDEPGGRGVLVGCSGDEATAFIRVGRSPKRTRVIAVPAERCHFERGRPEAAAGDVVGGAKGKTLPLFEGWEGAAEPTQLEGRRVKGAGKPREDEKRSKAA
jgi:hypothetical protein